MDLKEILVSVRRGDFDEAVVDFATSEDLLGPGDDEYYQWLSLKSDVLDQLGQYRTALQLLLKPCETLIVQLRRATHAPQEWQLQLPQDDKMNRVARKRWRQMIWCCLNCALSLYRNNRPDDAEQYLLVCENFIDSCLQGQGFSCDGSLCRLHYFRGHIYRERRDSRADQEFTKSIEFANLRLEAKFAGPQSETEERFAHTCLGKNLGFGYGWLASHRGEYRQARKYFQAASILLHGTADRLLWAHLQILSASCRRKEIGPDYRLEDEVVKPLIEAYAEVQANQVRPKHSHYAASAAYELGMAFYYLAMLDTDRKKEFIEKATDWHSRMTADSKQSSVLGVEAAILLARIQWLSGDEFNARKGLGKTYEQIIKERRPQKTPSPQLARILVSLAEVEIAIAEKNTGRKSVFDRCIERAIKLLDQAFACAHGSPLTGHIVNFHRARCFFLQGDEIASLYALRPIESEHGWLTKQVAGLTQQIQQRKGLLLINFTQGFTRQRYVTEFLDPWLGNQMKIRLEGAGLRRDLAQEVVKTLGVSLRWAQRYLGRKPGRPRSLH